VIDIPAEAEVVCGPPFVHSDIPLEMGPVWRVVSGVESDNFNYWPAEVDDPLPPIPDRFGGFS
jgi:hypothetical protein